MRKFLASFWWCLANAIVCLWLLAINLEAGDTLWSWVMIALIVYWTWAGKRALNTPSSIEDELTDEQKDRLKAAAAVSINVMEEVDAEVKASRLARKLKAKEKK
jgi:hypothetical protein